MLLRGGAAIAHRARGRCRDHRHLCGAAKQHLRAANRKAPEVARAMDPVTPATGPSDCRIVAVGDVHGSWSSPEDLAALQLLKPDMVAFLGDFGNEDVELVMQVRGMACSVAC